MTPEFFESGWAGAEWTDIAGLVSRGRSGELIPLLLREISLDGKSRIELPASSKALHQYDFRRIAAFEREFEKLLRKVRGQRPLRGAILANEGHYMKHAREQINRLLTVLSPGAHSLLGYHIQSVTALFELLTAPRKWQSLTIEPKESLKTDIRIDYTNNQREHIQVKSRGATGHFSRSEVDKLLNELRSSNQNPVPDSTIVTVRLVLVGEMSPEVRSLAEANENNGNYLIECRGSSDPVQSLEALSHGIFTYLWQMNRRKASPEICEVLARLILSEVQLSTVTGGRFTPESFNERIDQWLREALRETSLPIHDLAPLRARGVSRFIGRGVELQELWDCWVDPKVTIVHVHAGPGCGKSALIIEWIRRLFESDSLKSFSALGWSFYNQDEHSHRTDSDGWFAAAKRHFPLSETNYALETPEGLGSAVAECHIRQGGLIILDGMETILDPFPPNRGEIRTDQAALRRMLADVLLRGTQNTQNVRRLLVITTRLPLKILRRDCDFVHSLPLGRLTQSDGEQLLTNFRVPDEPSKRLHPKEEFASVTDELNGHPLSLCLLAAYVLTKYQGNLEMRSDFASFTGKSNYSRQSQDDDVRHASHILKHLADFLSVGSDIQKASLGFLRILAIVARPISLNTIRTLIDGTAISGITDTFDCVDLNDVVRELKVLGLISETHETPNTRYSSHPIIRSEVRNRLRKEIPTSWQEFNLHVHLFYLNEGLRAPRLEPPQGGVTPRSREEYDKLYLAVVHGCQAQLYDRMFCDIYRKEITDGDWGTATRSYSFFRLQYDVLRCFFDHSDGHLPAMPLLSNERDQIILLREVGYCLWKLGQIDDAANFLQDALQKATALRAEHDWEGDRRDRTKSENITIIGRNLTNLLIDQGRFVEAIAVWTDRMNFADNPPTGFMSFGVRCSLGVCFVYIGKVGEAKILFEQALERAHNSEWKRLFGLPLCHYCEYLAAAGDHDIAFRLLDEELQSKPTKANAGLAHLAWAGVYCSRAERVPACAQQALEQVQLAIEALLGSGRRDTLPDAYTIKSLSLVRVQDSPNLDEAKTTITIAKELAEQVKSFRSFAWATVVENFINCLALGVDAPSNQISECLASWDNCKKMVQAMNYYSLEPLLGKCHALIETARTR